MDETDEIQIIRQDEYTFPSVLHFYAKYSDKAWSFTDCMSFYVMHVWEITDSLTHDHHFEQAGFRALMRI
jgi:predicted nucleic acid-binding protein